MSGENHAGTQVVVIGAGPAGMTAAYRLAQLGAAVELFEASPSVGGMARTIDLWGGRVDIGPHRFFSADRRVNRLWLEVAGDDYQMVDRLTRIYYNGAFFLYPLRPFNALGKLGPVEALRCIGSYLRARRTGRGQGEVQSFEEWVVQRFGRRLFNLFFKTYSEKLWGIPCSELDADFAAQRIRGLSLWGAVANALFRGRGNRHKTLVDRFAYPIGGTGSMYERMSDRVEASGGHVHRSCGVDRIIVDQGKTRGVRLQNGEAVEAREVVSSMPLTLLVERLESVPDEVRDAAQSLRFRNTILVYLHVDAIDLFPDNWLYVHAPDLAMGRITNFRNWSPSLHPPTRTTILALEYWCSPKDDEWGWEDRRLIARGTRELTATGLLRGARVIDGTVLRIPRCYPVYRRGYAHHVETIRRHLATIEGLQVIGRYGAFKYNNQDHSILMGLLAAENIMLGTRHDLWGVNADYDAYQEGTRITETGLVDVSP